MKSSFELNGGTYRQVGDYYLPDLTLVYEKENTILGKYGRMRLTYLKESQKAQYSLMVMNGTLKSHLRDVDDQAAKILDQTIKAFAETDGCNEKLKQTDQMKWIGLMNNYRHCAEEIIFKELIYV